jgi:hypothetical protein
MLEEVRWGLFREGAKKLVVVLWGLDKAAVYYTVLQKSFYTSISLSIDNVDHLPFIVIHTSI